MERNREEASSAASLTPNQILKDETPESLTHTHTPFTKEEQIMGNNIFILGDINASLKNSSEEGNKEARVSSL